MARPIKNNCDYFPHDAGMRNHSNDVFGKRWKRPDMVTIYLIRVRSNGIYKIGYTSQIIASRLSVIKYYHGEVELIDSVHSCFAIEKQLHDKFSGKRVTNGYREFFKLDSDDVEYVKSLFKSLRNG